MVGIGPGAADDRTRRAERHLLEADVIIGYRPYLDKISDLAQGKRLIASGMRQERERIDHTIDEAQNGANVALVSSGDAGIYGMAGALLERLTQRGLKLPVTIVPGVTSAVAAAAALGAPLMLDYVTLSLSDQLVSFDVICHRLECVAKADLVIALYNPRSSQRKTQLTTAREILLRHRAAETLVGLAKDVTGPNQSVQLTTLGALDETQVDMHSLLIIGNSTTRHCDGYLVTPRGYYET